MNDIDRARSALHAIDSGCPRAEWVKLAMAIEAAGLTFDDFFEWSRPAHNHRSEADCRSVWRSLDANGGIGAGTLFAKAREAGWREPMNGHGGPRKAEQKAERPAFDFAAVWRDSEAATVDHEYVRRKLGLADGLRVYRGDLKLNGQALDGALLVPALDADGSLRSWQAIPPDGDKRNAPGATIKGASFTVGGAPREGEPLFLCEGVGAAWTAHQTTGKPAVVCFGAGNVETIARQIHERHPKARIVVVADAGKERDAERIAGVVGGAWIAMPDGSPANFDLNDFHQQVRSLEAVAELLAQAKVRPAATTLPPIKSAAALLAQDFAPIRWLIPGLLPEGLMLLAARPKVGKSWLALDVAIACATGGRVFGRPVERGDVLYLALEDNDRRMHSRLSKLGAAGAGLGDLVYATEWPRGAEGAAAIHAWIKAHPGARLVVIDVFTKLRAATEGRETAYSVDYADVSMLKPPADRSISILLVHHTRKAESDDPLDSVSGTLGIGGAADGAWILKRARGSDEAELHLIGRDLEEEGAFAVRFDRSTCRWQWLGDVWKVRMTAERRQALQALTGTPMKPADLAKALGKTQGAVRKMIHDMVQDGQIERGLDGKYRPVEPEGTF
ncbi:MAG: AAA family ATPase [Burkholderiaceae bacterium]|nr:AAA family ATPase [Burkholderiaceae bacterium]